MGTFPCFTPGPWPNNVAATFLSKEEQTAFAELGETLAPFHPTGEDFPFVDGAGILSSRVQTQKARGYVSLANGDVYNTVQTLRLSLPSPVKTMILPWSSVPSFLFLGGDRWFARPCPTVPRHGFVDSRPVGSFEELLKVWKETLAEDPRGELILAPILEGEVSAVATSAGVAWGKGNDGATSGASVFLPCPVDVKVWKKLAAGIVSTSTGQLPSIGLVNEVYLEIVQHKDMAVLVQMRDGPVQPRTEDFIPREVKVTQVLNEYEATDVPLLVWEERISKLAADPGVVCWFPNLGLSSHYSVHCLEKGIPVVKTFRPKEGDVLSPKGEEKKRADKETLAKMCSVMLDWEKRDLSFSKRDKNALALTAIATIHARGQWELAPTLNLQAAALPSLERFILASLVGEDRHILNRITRSEVKLLEVLPDFTLASSRDSCYTPVLEGVIPREKRKAAIKALIKDFDNSCWEGGYGGRKWKACAEAALYLHTALDVFYTNSTEANLSSAFVAANLAVNAAHNNGKIMTKWIENRALTLLNTAPSAGLLSNMTGKILLGLM